MQYHHIVILNFNDREAKMSTELIPPSSPSSSSYAGLVSTACQTTACQTTARVHPSPTTLTTTDQQPFESGKVVRCADFVEGFP